MTNTNSTLIPNVIPAQAGNQLVDPIDFGGSQFYKLDSRLRGNDDTLRLWQFLRSPDAEKVGTGDTAA